MFTKSDDVLDPFEGTHIKMWGVKARIYIESNYWEKREKLETDKMEWFVTGIRNFVFQCVFSYILLSFYFFLFL